MPVPTKDEPAGFSLPSYGFCCHGGNVGGPFPFLFVPSIAFFRVAGSGFMTHSSEFCCFYQVVPHLFGGDKQQMQASRLLETACSFCHVAVIYLVPCSYAPKCNLDIFQRPNKPFLLFPLTFQCPIQN